MGLGFGTELIVMGIDVHELQNMIERLPCSFAYLLFSHQPSVGIDLSVQIDGKSLLTYTSNVYITKENYDTDANLLDGRGEGTVGNHRPDAGSEAK
jgi:hypothetical protein